MSYVTKFILICLALIMAITLALLSVYVERIGPELAVYGNLCGPSGSDFCYKPLLKGGFPVPYLFDATGVSVERQLAFVEDDLFVGALILDIVTYLAIVLSTMMAISRWRSGRTQSARFDRT